MNHLSASPRPGSAAEVPDTERFRVRDPLEIASLLRTAITSRTLVTVTYREGGGFFVSALLAVRPDRGDIIIDSGPDEEANELAIDSQRLVVGAMLDNVSLHFQSPGARAVTYQGYRAISMPFPESVVRMQRRDSYRIRIPPSEILVCEIRRLPVDPKPIQLSVINLSCGGVALENWPDGQAPEAGRVCRNSRLHLGDDSLHVDLEIVNVIDRNESGGQPMRRCGARFVDMPARLLTQVQRYIMRIERKLLEARREADEAVAGPRGTRR